MFANGGTRKKTIGVGYARVGAPRLKYLKSCAGPGPLAAPIPPARSAYTTGHRRPEEMSESEEERRPRPIGVADESEGDSETERNDAGRAGANGPASGTTGDAAPETTTKKPSKKMPAFSENDLVKDKGLRQIYKDFPQKCRYKGKGREVRNRDHGEIRVQI